MKLAEEKDSCGVGFVVHSDGTEEHAVIEMALEALANHAHRGAVGADGKTGDGAGLMTALAYNFFSRIYQELYQRPAPPRGDFAVGNVFLPLCDAKGRSHSRRTLEESLRYYELEPLGWRETPINLEALGPRARSSRPHFQQIFVGRGSCQTEQFEKALYMARRRSERLLREEGIEDFYVASLSSKSIVYKGLCMANQLGNFYPDLHQPDYTASVALFHQRYSTNTFPRWELAQPFRRICHNGEFNTLQGNWNWMKAREMALGVSGHDPNVYDLTPVIAPNVSDSGAFDNVLEFFTQTGRPLLPALMTMIPEIWENVALNDIPSGWRDLYRYLSCLMEPWDGPAALAFYDGRYVGTLLDRNGLRPMRYVTLKNGLVIASSEAGCVNIDDSAVVKKGMLGPGEMFVIDTKKKEIYSNHQIKQQVSESQPYGEFLKDRLTVVDPKQFDPTARQRLGEPGEPTGREGLHRRQIAFGYNNEDEITVLRPMMTKGQEPVGSMGDDTPPAVISRVGRPLFHYFRQRFAQVTNPPIDPLREQLVMSLRTLLGRRANVLTEEPEVTRLLEFPGPILTPASFHHINNLSPKLFPIIVLRSVWPVQSGPNALEERLERLCGEAEEAVRQGAVFVVIYDGGVNAFRAPIPSLLITSAVHHRLVRAGLRLQASVIVASGEPREVHHFACLLGYGADAIYPFLAFDTIDQMLHDGGKQFEGLTQAAAHQNFVTALEKGLQKIMAKMGISVLSSYRAGQVFEALGLDESLVTRYFPNTASPLGGSRLEELAFDQAQWHLQAFADELSDPAACKLGSYGFYKYKRDGEAHRFTPALVKALHTVVKAAEQMLRPDSDPFLTLAQGVPHYQEYAKLAQSQPPTALRDLLDFVQHRPGVPLEEVEPLQSIVSRFSTGAMSFGSLSSEAHETLSKALNRLGAASNCGEGGEPPERYRTPANSKIKQIASGRFGVTPEYLMYAQEIQIKIAQGAKPGEGGQIPGHKVSLEIARVRHTSPGIALISPPPHHDIYSIEDLSQLINDLRRINPQAKISVKLVSQEGVGTVAAGVAKGYADIIHLSGADGGTGASPLSSIKFAGMPWELGLSQVQQTLVANELRGQVRLRVDGGFQTGKDVLIAALLGADEYSFGTSALVAEGCLMARSCHTNTCPVGIASQDPALRAKFPGTVEGVVAYLIGVAHEVRQLLAKLGARSLDEVIGCTELLEQTVFDDSSGRLDLSPILRRDRDDKPHRHLAHQPPPRRGRDLDAQLLEQIDSLPSPIEIRNTDRTFGARISWWMLQHLANQRQRDTAIAQRGLSLKLVGTAGQSFGAFAVAGLRLELEGQANDYVGKGLAGGEIVIRPSAKTAGLLTQENWILGNTVLYGATSGQLFAAGRAGMRFCVRNSGATAVVEGVGEHACEYMTGGLIVILGSIGRNFGAAMTGGVAYIYDQDKNVRSKLNPELIEALPVSGPSVAELRSLIELHLEKTGSSQARRILSEWQSSLPRFWRVAPRSSAATIEAHNEGHDRQTAGSTK